MASHKGSIATELLGVKVLDGRTFWPSRCWMYKAAGEGHALGHGDYIGDSYPSNMKCRRGHVSWVIHVSSSPPGVC